LPKESALPVVVVKKLLPLGPRHFVKPSPVGRGADALAPRRTGRHDWYWPIRAKFVFSLGIATAWFAVSYWLANLWIADLSAMIGPFLAWFAVGGIALVPGFMNAFLAASLLVDRRPARRTHERYPGISILVAAYNEGASIADTIQSIAKSEYPGDFEVIIDGVGGATFGLAIEHLSPRGVVVNIATQDDEEMVSFRAGRFDRARGAAIYTLNLPDELAAHASAASDLTRLCTLAADGRLDGQVELECSWRQPGPAIDALLNRRIGGKAVLHVD
jgi:hypothetical protein